MEIKKNVIDVISSLRNVQFAGPTSMEQIRAAESELELKLAKDYIEYEYVLKYGVVSAKRIELTGITKHERLNVVSVTKSERELNSNMPDNMYVIENVGIDGILILQDSNGTVYSFIKNRNPIKISNSLAEYIESVA